MPIAVSGREGPLAGYRHGTWHFQARSSGRDGVRPVLGEAEIAGHGFTLLRFRSGRRLLISRTRRLLQLHSSGRSISR